MKAIGDLVGFIFGLLVSYCLIAGPSSWSVYVGWALVPIQLFYVFSLVVKAGMED